MNTVQGQNIALKDSLRMNEKVCERPLRAYLIFRALIRIVIHRLGTWSKWNLNGFLSFIDFWGHSQTTFTQWYNLLTGWVLVLGYDLV